MSERDIAFGRLAIARGLVSEEAVRASYRERGGASLKETLVRRGLLARAQAETLDSQVPGPRRDPGATLLEDPVEFPPLDTGGLRASVAVRPPATTGKPATLASTVEEPPEAPLGVRGPLAPDGTVAFTAFEAPPLVASQSDLAGTFSAPLAGSGSALEGTFSAAPGGLTGTVAVPPPAPSPTSSGARHGHALPEPGALVGDYAVQEKLGAGNMGAVFLGRHRTSGQEVAIKLTFGGSQTALARFDREIVAMKKVDPGVPVVHVRDVGAFGPQQIPYAVMDFIRGHDLQKELDRGRVRLGRALEVVEKVARAVHACHEQGIIHRDLKPANILIREADGEPFVADFGLARVKEMERLTATGTLLGTPIYMAPEQAHGNVQEQDRRTDVYALGAILYELLSGEVPFQAQNAAQLLLQISREVPPSPAVHDPSVPSDACAIALKCLAKRREDRYQTALELADDVARARQGERTRGRLVSRARRTARFVGEHPIAVAAALAVAIGAPAGIVARTLSRTHELERCLARAHAADASARELEALVGRLQELRAPRSDLALLEHRHAARALAEAVTPLEGTPAASRRVEGLLAVVARACEAPDEASLVGEHAGLAIGDALLERRDALLSGDAEAGRDATADAAALLSGARRLARARLAQTPGDLPARFLQALATLAERGAPRTALGPGRLGLAADALDAVDPELDAASELAGRPGERAAWLRVDLLASAGPSFDKRARQALARAVARAPRASAREPLERALAATPDATGFAALRAAVGDPPQLAPLLALSRFLARLGLPTALEHAEVALDPSPAAVAAAVARDDPDAFARRPVSGDADEPHLASVLRRLEAVLDTGHPHGGVLAEPDPEFEVHMRQKADFVWPNAIGFLDEAFGEAPWNVVALELAGDGSRRRTSRVLFDIVAEREALCFARSVSIAFGYFDREKTRANLTADYFPPDVFEFPDTAPALVGPAFDQRLASDLAADRREFLGHVNDPAFFEALERARRATEGLRRLEVLVETPPERFAKGEREQVIFEALARFEDFERLGGALVLPFRAKLRRLAFPGTAGEALAQLDLARIVQVVERARASESCTDYLILALSVAATAERELPGVSRVADLRALLFAWAHEEAVRDGTRGTELEGPTRGLEALSHQLASALDDRPSTWPAVEGVGRVLPRDMVEDALRPTREDEERVRSGHYEFRRPALARVTKK